MLEREFQVKNKRFIGKFSGNQDKFRSPSIEFLQLDNFLEAKKWVRYSQYKKLYGIGCN